MACPAIHLVLTTHIPTMKNIENLIDQEKIDDAIIQIEELLSLFPLNRKAKEYLLLCAGKLNSTDRKELVNKYFNQAVGWYDEGKKKIAQCDPYS